MNPRQIQYLRPEQIRAEIEKAPIAYLPLGLVEWHGHHLPMGVDAFNAETVAKLAAEESGGLVMPTVYFGTDSALSQEWLDFIGFEQDQYIVGMNFPAITMPSMYVSEEAFAIMLREQLRLIARMGFKLIAVLTGHGAPNQGAVMRRLAAEFSAGGAVKVLALTAFPPDTGVGHASRAETSITMALVPETVKLDNLPPPGQPLWNVQNAIIDYHTFSGEPNAERTVHADDDPRLSSAEEGHEMIQRTARHVAALVKEALAG